MQVTAHDGCRNIMLVQWRRHLNTAGNALGYFVYIFELFSQQEWDVCQRLMLMLHFVVTYYNK